jgi:hypothetical protein
MQEFDPDAVKRHDGSTDLEKRDVRALTEVMSVLPEGGDIYTVVGENDETYTVDAREGRCECPDHQYREATCKHIRRVAYATGERSIPEWVNADAVDDQLGLHVDGSPRQVATDGGIIEASDDGEILTDDGDDVEEDTEENERPEDCDCGSWNEGLELPCFPCYRDGFEQPNPDAIDQ